MSRRTSIIFLWLALATPLYAQTGNETCFDCHDDSELVADDGRQVGVLEALFTGSVHGDFECIDCHSEPGDYDDTPHYTTYTPVQCGECHEDVWEEFERSVHHLGRRGMPDGAATCSDCHGTHNILSPSDSASTAHHANIPNLCGKCHSSEVKTTVDFVRLPIALPSYRASVHGQAWLRGVYAAACTDCHGAHGTQIASAPESRVHFRNVAATCGQCHEEIAAKYSESIHGKAVALGIKDSPTCTDCHAEHLIRKGGDPRAKVSPEHRARQLCGDCHTDPELVTKYALRGGVLESYLDSYHAWAVDRGSQLAANCTDCHNVHDIRSPLDPASSVHTANITATCARCHESVTADFANSYTHQSALAARSVHGWVKLFYIGLIVVVLGGMGLHNFIVARHELKRHRERRRSEPYIVRWMGAERAQHMAMLFSFTGLAITGFALRYPNAWWVQMLQLGGHEAFRANLHRSFGVLMLTVAFYHIIWVIVSRRGRAALRSISPTAADPMHVLQNMAFHLGLRKERPTFGAFDYTQKAEYWAVVWGTWIMAMTGFVLWFPTIATHWMPAWVVRVSEVIHYFEAILAVSAIFVWHFFYVIFMPREYPMSTIWLDGRMPASEWQEMHRGEFDAVGRGAVRYPDEEAPGDRDTAPAEPGDT